MQLAQWVTRHPKQVLAAWTLAAALALPFGWQAPGRMVASVGELPGTESTHVTHLLRDEFGENDNNVVLVTFEAPAQLLPEGQAALEKVPGSRA
ncbi:hypothetical protein ACFP81_12160 [Deinococcus lacus]|uniref:Membrane transport protein MMPL domain-containing protein n=1 Tax=Deinococcus lacus TaxID=392561 RepID=A0ABW1YE78_9DEIO